MNKTQSLPIAQPNWRLFWPPLIALGILLLWLGLVVYRNPTWVQFPVAWNIGLRQPIDAFQGWIVVNRTTHPLFLYFFEPLRLGIDWGLRGTEGFLLSLPWIVIMAAFVLAGFGLGGWRLALFCGASLLLIGAFEVWERSLQTFALMAVSVLLSITLGLPLGIFAGLHPRFDRVLRPVLDGMQTMPTFVYLLPVLLFFGIQRVPAVVATLIYALPPLIRLTSLGLQQVNPSAIEAARAFGATRWQVLFNVQLPLALPVIMTGINQTIMMALSMVVIAALIGAGGLGQQVLQSLQRLEVGRALEGGLAIVLMAIMLDRLSEALSQIDLTDPTPRQRTLPKWWPAAWDVSTRAALDWVGRALTIPARFLASALNRHDLERYGILITSLLILVGLLALDQIVHFGTFPETWRWSLRQPTDLLVKWMRDNLFKISMGGIVIGTGPTSDFITLYLLNPLRDLLTVRLPWPVIVLGIAAMGGWAGGWKLALFSGGGIFAIGLLGMWSLGMDTLSQILATLLFTIALALPLGLWSSQNDTVRSLLRPLLDFLQTIPSFVFLVPVIMLFNIGRVPGIIAAVLYAIAPGVKLIDLGLRQVSGEALEAARAFGSTRAQTLAKVQVPMALPAILLGVNQMIMMILAMVIISGMVGGAGLGLEAVNGLARNQTGRGIEAGLAIVLLAIIMDRITQAWAAKQN